MRYRLKTHLRKKAKEADPDRVALLRVAAARGERSPGSAGFSRCEVGWRSGSRAPGQIMRSETHPDSPGAFSVAAKTNSAPHPLLYTHPLPITHPLCVRMKERPAVNGRAVRARSTQLNKPSFFWNCVQFAHTMHRHTYLNTPLLWFASIFGWQERTDKDWQRSRYKGEEKASH